MLISDTLNDKIKEAMKARDSIRVSTLKMLSSEIHNAKIDNKGELTSELEMIVLKKEAKKRKDSIEAYRNANREDLATAEEAELKILQELLPEEMSDDQIQEIVAQVMSDVGANGPQDMGKVMSGVLAKTAGLADGAKVSSVVREKLSSL